MKSTQENLSSQKGITLIALIITIIILLILAGISIAMLTGENGILSRAESTDYASAQGELTEKISLAISESIMDRDNDHTIDAVLEIAKANGFISDEGHTISKTEAEATITHNETGATVVLLEVSIGKIKVTSGDNTEVGGDNSTEGTPTPETEEDTQTESGPVSIGSLASNVSVGDYIVYDAGEWTQADLDLIRESEGSPTVNGTEDLPTTQGQFGGFALGQSRNSNSTAYLTSCEPRTEGWRVWSIEGDTVTIVHAGHPELYYHASGSSEVSTTILRNRNTEMYENEYAEKSWIMTGEDATNWHNTQYGTDYVIVDNGGSSTSTFHMKTFSTDEPIEVLENNSYYWLAAPYSSDHMYVVHYSSRYVIANFGHKFGVRPLVSLKSDIQTSGVNDNGAYELMLK